MLCRFLKFQSCVNSINTNYYSIILPICLLKRKGDTSSMPLCLFLCSCQIQTQIPALDLPYYGKSQHFGLTTPWTCWSPTLHSYL